MSRQNLDLAIYIDHTLLKPTATEKEIFAVCEEAILFNFASVCVSPNFANLACNLLVSSNVNVCTVVGFPLGYSTTKTKAAEILQGLEVGVSEFDIVINQGLLKDENHDALICEMFELTQLVQRNYGIVKWIVETAYLNELELVNICDYCIECNADYIKTSTGFAPKGAQLKDVKLWKKQIGDNKLKIKASGGIKNYLDACSFIEAGATRLGCSSGVQILKESINA